MNIELRRRIAPLLPRVSSGVNDNTEERPNARPQHRVIIFKPAKSTITSGRARRKQWLLEFEPQSAPFIEPLMGWTGSTDPLASMQLGFSSRDAAIAYAERQGLEYEVREPALRPGAPERRADHQPNPLAAPLMPVGSGVTPLKVDLAA
jgi:hypothetical protein